MVEYALRYRAHPEDIEYGVDKDRWFKFNVDGEEVWKFKTLRELLKASMKLKAQQKNLGYGEVYKISGRSRKSYADLYLRLNYGMESLRYPDSSKKIVEGSTVLWLTTRLDKEPQVYAVAKDGSTKKLVYIHNPLNTR